MTRQGYPGTLFEMALPTGWQGVPPTSMGRGRQRAGRLFNERGTTCRIPLRTLFTGKTS
jgi:hypothetical protein